PAGAPAAARALAVREARAALAFADAIAGAAAAAAADALAGAGALSLHGARARSRARRGASATYLAAPAAVIDVARPDHARLTALDAALVLLDLGRAHRLDDLELGLDGRLGARLFHFRLHARRHLRAHACRVGARRLELGRAHAQIASQIPARGP